MLAMLSNIVIGVVLIDCSKNVSKSKNSSKELAIFECTFGMSTPNCLYYQLDRSRGQYSGENIVSVGFSLVLNSLLLTTIFLCF